MTATPDGGFESFVIARRDALHRTAYRLTRDHALAEDLVQSALAKAWTRWSRIDENPEGYVRTVMVHTYLRSSRRRWRGEHPTAELPEQILPAADAPIEDRGPLIDALSALPRRQRTVIVLRFAEDLSEAQTAALMGTTVGTVKSQTAKALARLRVDPHLAEHSSPATPVAVRMEP
jgi:RNA polymerase sigma-70 factor (sigma-E family)